ncbi:hypothetical protein [Metabacillus fastidiosus]|uniref:hypothetical protein n=1 Tax=Metabacillus fastidiosus TaxID=1458 RepID=UPI003D2B552A
MSYKINTPSSTIRNEISDRYTAGKYRARLAGTFTTLKNGPYAPNLYDWAQFEVK